MIEVFKNVTQRKQNDMRFVWEHAHVMLKQILMGNENSFSRIGETFFSVNMKTCQKMIQANLFIIYSYE